MANADLIKRLIAILEIVNDTRQVVEQQLMRRGKQ